MTGFPVMGNKYVLRNKLDRKEREKTDIEHNMDSYGIIKNE